MRRKRRKKLYIDKNCENYVREQDEVWFSNPSERERKNKLCDAW